jgi:hypothetical protein
MIFEFSDGHKVAVERFQMRGVGWDE